MLALPASAVAAEGAGVIVRYKPGTSAAERLDARRDAGVTRQQGLLLARTELVDPGAGVSARAAIAALEANPDVAFAEVNGRRYARAVPNDPFFPADWGLENTGQSAPANADFHTSPVADADVDASAAWDGFTGATSVPVAIVDTGMDLAHPDLAPNLWSAGDGSHGIDFACRDEGLAQINRCTGGGTTDNNPNDTNGHGTHVSGTVGARGNDGVGVAGVNWTAAMMAVRVLGPDGGGSDADVVNGEAWAPDHGARVVNLSLGASTPLDAELQAIQSHPNTLFVVAAGNDSLDNDSNGDFPCNYNLDNIICVAASDRDDQLASFSNFGAHNVDLAAPGVDIASTWPSSIPAARRVDPGDNRWALESGTSMATPHVAGVASLLLNKYPQLTTADLRRSILEGVDKLPQLSGLVATGGRLNAAGAMAVADRIAAPPPPPPPPPPPAQSQTQTQSQTTQASASTADLTAPVLGLTFGRRVHAARGLRIGARCSEACTVSYVVTLDARTARRAHVGRTAARRTVKLPAASLQKTTLRLSRAMRKLKAGRLSIRVTAVDAAGNRSVKTASARLVR